MLNHRSRLRLVALTVATLTLLGAVGAAWRLNSATPSDATEDSSAFSQLMTDSMAQMTTDARQMAMSGDADQDFAAMMIVHHRGAVAMAKAQLLHGKNPVLRRLAQEIVITQSAEIVVLQRALPPDNALCR